MDEPKTYSEDYVKELRAEAAKGRVERRELESQLESYKALEGQITQVRVENELIRRGVDVDPSFIKLAPDMTPKQAVDTFLETYPQFLHVEGSQSVLPQPKEVPPALGKNPANANVPGPGPKGTISGRTADEIKADPIARNNLRNLYRSLTPRGQGWDEE